MKTWITDKIKQAHANAERKGLIDYPDHEQLKYATYDKLH